MNENLYNMLVEGPFFTHSIGKINEPETIKKLASIIELNGLYSKEKLKNSIPGGVTGKVNGHIRITKEKFISLFDPTSYHLRKKLLSPTYHRFCPLNDQEITFLIDSSVEYLPGAFRNEFDYSELNILDFLSIDYFRGIIIPNNKELMQYIVKILKEKEIKLPIYDTDGNLLSNFDLTL